MGLEALQAEAEEKEVSSSSSSSSLPLVIGLQPLALVDQVARVDWSLLNSIPGERGGSQRVKNKPNSEPHISSVFFFLFFLFWLLFSMKISFLFSFFLMCLRNHKK